jgi:ubiquinone/menaquinone biosynthesis C-methylase UbiE
MGQVILRDLVKQNVVVDKGGILVAKEIAERTVWDTLAVENPTHAVISAKDEAEAARKSVDQIEHIKAHITPDCVVLDCGTGYGRVAKYLLPKMYLAGYVGVDRSYEMLTLFKRWYDVSDIEQQTPLLLLNADIHTVPLRDESVDVVIVSAVYLHNHKDVVTQAVAEAFRVLKSGGTMLVYSSFPRGATMMGVQGHTYQMVLNLLGKPFKNGPVRYYSRQEVVKLFADFSELDIVPVGFAVLPKTLIFLPNFLEAWWRKGIANPVNRFLERTCPVSLKPYFAVHYDVIARR